MAIMLQKTERIDDISLAEEERLESMETSIDSVNALPEAQESNPPLDSMPTQHYFSRQESSSAINADLGLLGCTRASC
jgi:hypothetical protein